MKKYIAMIAAALSLSACSSDYLETSPEDSVATPTIFSTTDNVKLAVNGLAKMMTDFYIGHGFNGEGTIKTWYNNYMGQDFQKCNLTGWSPLINNESSMKQSNTSGYNYYIWFYYYKIIGNANAVIVNVDNASGAEADKEFYKAQALVYRAYSYSQLVQFYSTRWASSDNGKSAGVVLRLDQSVGDLPLSSLGEVYAQIYKDLDDAIALFKSSGKDSDKFFLPGLNAAYAVYARAALNREDWTNAAKYAALARAGYPLMSSKQYADGFSEANDEWIWGVYESEDQSLFYYGFFANQGANSSANICKSFPCAISKELIDQIPETDVRRSLYLVPTEEEYAECDKSGQAGPLLQARANQEIRSKLFETSLVYAYMQTKFRAQFMPGGGSFSLFRAAEMYYIEAEADCHLNKDAEAQQLIYEANKDRDASLVKSSKTGAELLDEVKLYRRFDLWGEGFDWSDCKRWNQDLVRKSKTDGGSFHDVFAVTIKASDEDRWTWVIPRKETDYNGALNQKTVKTEE